jgi:hypothetical protein
MPFDAEPEWTETAEKRGLDPLGLQVSGIALYQDLLPGISNVTLHIRYYGLYAWLTDTYGRLSGNTDPAEWRRWVRRTEALYALTATAAGGESGVAGVDWAANTLKDFADDAVIDFRPGTEITGPKLYLRNALGVYGGAYASQLVEMGFLAQHETFDMLVPTPDLGRPLADAFRGSLGPDLEGLLISRIQEGLVARTDLGRLSAILPSKIPEGSAEAEIYVKALFALGDEPDQRAENRRHSLQLILAVAGRLGRLPRPDEVRWAMFNSPPGDFGPELERERLLWEAYQTHDLLQLAFAAFLRLSIEKLRQGGVPLAFPDLVELAAGDLCATIPTGAASSWGTFVAGAAGADPAPLEKMLSGLRAHSLPPEAVQAALTLMASLQARVDARPDLAAVIDERFPPVGPSTFARSIRSELAFLRGRSNAAMPDLARDLLADRIVRRHSQVAMLKFARQRDYTFLFEADDARLKYRAGYAPVLTTPRLGPAITFLADLRLIGSEGLTPMGEALTAASA